MVNIITLNKLNDMQKEIIEYILIKLYKIQGDMYVLFDKNEATIFAEGSIYKIKRGDGKVLLYVDDDYIGSLDISNKLLRQAFKESKTKINKGEKL